MKPARHYGKGMICIMEKFVVAVCRGIMVVARGVVMKQVVRKTKKALKKEHFGLTEVGGCV